MNGGFREMLTLPLSFSDAPMMMVHVEKMWIVELLGQRHLLTLCERYGVVTNASWPRDAVQPMLFSNNSMKP